MSDTVPQLVRIAWLQGMMSHRCITQNQSNALYKRACQAVQVPYHANAYNDMIEDAKSSIGTFDLEIRGLVDEATGSNLIALVNTKSDALAQGATAYSSQEIIYIKRLIKAIFTAPDEAYSVRSMKALSESSKIKPHMTKRACEELLASLVRHDWIEKSRTGHYSLTTRTILELQTYLKNEYPDYVLECTQCMDIITKGFACSTEDCEGRFHNHCNRAAGGSSSNRKCPKCKNDWVPEPIGEASIGSNRKPNPEVYSDEEVEPEETANNATDSNRKVSQKKSRRSNRGDDDDEEEEEDQQEEEEEEEEEEEAQGSSRRKSNSSVQRKSNRKSTVIRVAGYQEEEEEEDE